MILSALDLTLTIGDSLTLGFGGSVPVGYGYWPLVKAKFGASQCPPLSAPFVPPVLRWPRNIGVNAAAGRATTAISGSMPALLAPYSPPTAVIIDLGINDANNILLASETVPQFSTATLAIVDALNSTWGIPYSKMLWIGPWGHDSGDLLTQIAQVEASLTTNAALRGFQWVQTSQTWNSSLTVGDGTHPNATGTAARAVPVAAAIKLAA